MKKIDSEEADKTNQRNFVDIALLKALGIYPVPDNMEIEISKNNKYLNFRLKDENGKHHLLFQLPLKEADLTYLKSRPDYQDLLDRYNTYTHEYIDEIKDYAIQERAYLQKAIPGLVFNIKIRTKSYESYLNKLNSNIKEGKSPYINDIMAERIILSEYNGSKDEETLTKMCDEVAKALYDFRINTNFRMLKDDSDDNKAKTDKEYVTKDYIAKPKPNGYKSLHLLMSNKKNPRFTYETQIRTFDMENMSKNSNEIAHKDYKPRILNDLSSKRVPSYSIITQFNDSMDTPIIIDIPFKMRFYHFYNTSLNNRLVKDNENNIPITYENYQKELEAITSSLGMSFQDIREKLRNIDITNYISKLKDLDEKEKDEK